MSQYNGWSNYATWRINLEILGDIQFDEHVSADYLQEIVYDCVFTNKESGLAKDYALAFLRDVNYYEIAHHINEEIDFYKQITITNG
jgi:hypothetical protein